MKHFLPRLTTQRLVAIAMLIALGFVIDQFKIPIIPQQLVISLQFVAESLIGSVAGPIYAFVAGALLDVITMLLSGNAANFIPLWTLMDALIPCLYGFFLYKKKLDITSVKDWIYVAVSVGFVTILGSLILTPLLIQTYYGTPFIAQYIAGRWFKIIEVPIRIVVIMLILPQLQRIKEYRRLIGLS